MAGYRGYDDVVDRRADELRDCLRDLEDAVAGLDPGQTVPGLDTIDGTDPTRTVTCTVDSFGRPLRIGIAPGWWESVGPAGIATAVLAALRFSRVRATLVRLVLQRHGHRFGAADTGLDAFVGVAPSEPLPPPDDPDRVRVLCRTLDRAEAILDQVERMRRQQDVPGRRVVTGPAGLFRVVLGDEGILGAQVDQYGLRPSDAGRLAEDAHAALLAAMPARQLGPVSGVGEDR